MSLEEYESQLQDVEALLAESPDEEEFIKLKNDLLELIALEKEQQQEQPEEAVASSIEAQVEASTYSSENATSASKASQGFEPIPETTETTTEAVPIAAKKFDKKTEKKLKKPFEIPEHLKPLESDTEAQRNKKKRTIKALKSKHKAAQKELDSVKKQSAWQDFNKKKKKKKKSDSIFKTADDGGKVGVVAVASSTSDAPSAKRQRHTF